MTQEENREQAIQQLTTMLRNYPFSFELKVKKNPKGIRIICEVTQEEMDAVLKSSKAVKN